MTRKHRRSKCPINFAVEIFGDKWTLLVIRDLMFKGKNHFGDFLRSEESIATNILADRLALLEMNGLVTKEADPEHGAKYIYRLSPKGQDLLPALTEIILWSAKYDNDSAVDRKFVRQAKADRVSLYRQVLDNLR